MDEGQRITKPHITEASILMKVTTSVVMRSGEVPYVDNFKYYYFLFKQTCGNYESKSDIYVWNTLIKLPKSHLLKSAKNIHQYVLMHR